MLASLRQRLAAENGMTLIELLTTLAILGVVLSGITAVFVAGIHSETGMNERFQAQQEVRLALTSIRKEIRTACWTSLDPPALSAGQTWQSSAATGIVLGSSCSTAAPTGATQVFWCTATSAAGGYALYRQGGSGPACSGGVRKADRLTSAAVFTVLAVGGLRPKVRVDFAVDANTTDAGGSYRLGDEIMLRNHAAS